ncbi:MAG: hypothetical protein U5J98_03175 [Halobacteriales archaeon]|nr:hypothetical protein [Halobacteriales archaeon]
MNAHNLIAIALAALLVFAGGAAALPGNAPDGAGADAADDHQPDDPASAADDRDADETETNETDSDDARDENASEGPPTDLPEPVPDHVSTIHQLIRDKLNGGLGNTTLGEAISGVVGGGDEADEPG